MKVIPPIEITDAMLVSSSIPEADHPPWDAGTAWPEDSRCVRHATHSVYLRLIAGATPDPPEDDPVNWKRAGPTSRWAMFDGVTGTLSRATDSLQVIIAPGLANSLALLDIKANRVVVSMVAEGEEVYRREVNLNTGIGVYDAYTYFFEPIVLKRTLVLTDLPPYSSGRINVTLIGDGEVALGTLVAGVFFELGKSLYGAGLGNIDYSEKTTDDFGSTTLVERDYAKRMTVPFVVEAWRGDEVMRRLGLLRAKLAVWVGATRFDSTVVYGNAMDSQVLIKYSQSWECSTTINGMT